MRLSTYARIGVGVVVAAACRPAAAPAPMDAADVAGRVLDVRDASALPGITLQQPGVSPQPAGASLHVLRVRVSGARAALPGSDATIGVDGSTQVAFADTTAPIDSRLDLTGSFVRVWTRGVPKSGAPSHFVAMARVLVVDSLPRRQGGQ